jgi:parallel beta-helix repeat protein
MGSFGKARPRRIAVAVATTLLLVAAVAAPAANATNGTLVLTQSTVLTADYAGNILIQADNVTLDCAGHTVSGPGDGDLSGGIQIDWASGVTVKDCIVTGSLTNGLYAHDATNTRITGSTFVGNSNHGLHLDGMTASSSLAPPAGGSRTMSR